MLLFSLIDLFCNLHSSINAKFTAFNCQKVFGGLFLVYWSACRPGNSARLDNCVPRVGVLCLIMIWDA